MIRVEPIQFPEVWEQFLLHQSDTLFVQSKNYADFYRAMGEKAWIFGVYNEGQLIGGTLAVSTHAKRGNFLYIPYGPVLDPTNHEAYTVLLETIRVFAREQKYDFVRVSPFLLDTPEHRVLFTKIGFRLAPIHVLAETTWILPLAQRGEEELLAVMNKNHRNLIRRCLSEGVRVTFSTDPNDLADFNTLHNQTAKRNQFHRFSPEYISKEFIAFAKENQAVLIRGYLPNGQLDSAAIVMYYGRMAAYRHGASLGIDKRLPTSYLVQWAAIQEARRRGIEEYNFWGIAPDGASRQHPFAGITHFKKGFGGYAKQLMPCLDLPLTSKYIVTWIIESIRRIRRGF